jgi:hypothetical protein
VAKRTARPQFSNPETARLLTLRNQLTGGGRYPERPLAYIRKLASQIYGSNDRQLAITNATAILNVLRELGITEPNEV